MTWEGPSKSGVWSIRRGVAWEGILQSVWEGPSRSGCGLRRSVLRGAWLGRAGVLCVDDYDT